MPTVSPCTTTVSPAKPIPLVVAATYISPFIPLNANEFHESKHENSTCYNFSGGEALSVARCSLANASYTATGKTLWSDPERYAVLGSNCIKEHIDAGITLADAVNFLVDKYELVRIDRKGFSWQEQTPYLSVVDILRARRSTGLLKAKVK